MMRKEMKILINTPPITGNGGVANHFLGLKNKFTKDVHYNDIGSEHRKINIIVLILFFDYLKFIFKLITIKPKVVHLNPSLSSKAVFREVIYLIIAKIFRKKVLIFWHGWNTDFEKKINTKYRQLFKIIYNNANAHIVLASDFKKKLQEWGITKPIFLETTKVDDKLLLNYSKNDIQNKKMQILFLARLEKNKGIFETIESFKLLQKKYKNLVLNIAGTGKAFDKVKAKIKDENLQNVKILGFVSGNQKVECIKDALFYMLPTTHGEGMPTSILEAMAFACIIISRPVGGTVDFFQENKMGHLIQSLNPEDYAQKIDKILSMQKEERIKISEYNYEFAKKKFYASTVAKRLEKIYKNL